MQYATLGRTGLFVSKLCLGCMTFGGKGFWKVVGTQGQDVVNGLVDRCLDAGINFVDTANVYSFGESERVMREVAAAKDVSVANIALAWLLHQEVVTSIIIGAKTPEQLEDNLRSTEVELTAEELARLDEVSALPPEYPGWMLTRMDEGRRPGDA